jgi:hypothetical protein
MFRDNVVLVPGEKIYVCASRELGDFFFKNNRTVSSLYFEINKDTELRLLSSLLLPVISKQVNFVNVLENTAPQLVINEINFRSSITKPAEDWIEIYNPGNTPVDMSAWYYSDSKNSNKYVFNQGVVLKPDGYLVVAQDSNAFKLQYPDVKNVVGNANFGLSGEGEFLRLFNKAGILVDSVYYRIGAPWPTNADATGNTLELSNANLDNNIGENWFVDNKKNGSPGHRNYLTSSVINTNELRFVVYPNPTTDYIFVKNEQQSFTYEIINLQGIVIVRENMDAFSTKRIDLTHIPRGVYMFKTTWEGYSKTIKIILN